MKTILKTAHPYLTIQIIISLLACLFSQGHFHFDEHFQILEFLNFKLGNINADELPWEFSAQIRPWFQVLLYFFLSKFFSFFGLTDPFLLPSVFRFMTALLAIMSLFLTIKVIQKKYSTHLAPHLLFVTSLTLWFWPFLSARISAECFNGLLFYNCVLFYLLQPNAAHSRLVNFSIFFVLLIAVWGRVQLAPALLGFCFWAYFIERSLKGRLLIMFSGLAAAAILNLMIDFWGYKTWAFTPWNYFYNNLIVSRASNFGVSPWYSYFPWIISKSGNPLGGLVILSALFFLWVRRPTSLLTSISLPFIVLHLFIGHKELRFIFPMAFFVPLLLVEVFGPFMHRKYAKMFVYAFACLNLTIGLVMALRPASPLIPIYKTMSMQKTPAEKLYYFGGENPLRPGDLPMNWYFSNSIQTVNIDKVSDVSRAERSWVFTDRYFRWKELDETSACIKLSNSYFEFLYPLMPEKIRSKTRKFDLWECQVVGT